MIESNLFAIELPVELMIRWAFECASQEASIALKRTVLRETEADP